MNVYQYAMFTALNLLLRMGLWLLTHRAGSPDIEFLAEIQHHIVHMEHLEDIIVLNNGIGGK
jgi:hypothetical protein